MTKFEKFDRKNLVALRAEMEHVLAKYGVDSNLQFEVGSMKFSDSEVQIKVSAKVKRVLRLSAMPFSNLV